MTRAEPQSHKTSNQRSKTASFATLILGYALATLLFAELHFNTTPAVAENGDGGGIDPHQGLSPWGSLKNSTYSSSGKPSRTNITADVLTIVRRQPMDPDTRNTRNASLLLHRHSSTMTRASTANRRGFYVAGPPLEGQGRPGVWDVLDDIDHDFPTAAQFLLDFAIIGNGKCGTTSLQLWLAGHPEILCPEKEVLQLSMKTVKEFIINLYMKFPASSWQPPSRPPTKEEVIDIEANSTATPIAVPVHSRGYKNPGEIRVPHAIHALATYFPKTILIVGIRHPVLWFQSLYNFKVQNLGKHRPATYWGHPNTLIGKCGGPMDFNCVGTYKGLFHVYLAYLGKTNRTVEVQEQYPDVWTEGSVTVTPNPVFLFDLQQLQDGMMTAVARTTLDDVEFTTNSTRITSDAPPDPSDASTVNAAYQRGLEFRRDVQSLLLLNRPLGPPPRVKPGKTWANVTRQQELDRQKIDICQDEFRPLRAHLMEISRRASIWIRTSGFLDSPTVHVSSKVYLEEEILAKQWMQDPCGLGLRGEMRMAL